MEGIHPTVANKYIAVSSEKMSNKDYLLKKTELIKYMERTNTSQEKGKWFFIMKKPNVAAAATYLDNELQTLYQKVVPKDLKFNLVPIPCCTKTRATQAIGSYVSVLMDMANPQEENMHLKKPLRSRKRAAIVITALANDTPQK
eukprot:14357826-Ditylum_brightwellii.AAC.1